MLHFLRKGIKSLPAKILTGLLVASFAVWGIGDIFSLRLDSQVARVGETEIPAGAFADGLVREQARVSRQAGQLVSYDMMRAAGLDRRILAGLIRDAAFAEEAKALGIDAPDEAVADAIRSNPSFQGPGGQFSPQAYSILLAQQRFSPAEFEELTRTLLTQQVITEAAEAAALPPPGAAARIAAYQGESRGATILTLTLDQAADPGTPDEGALRAFYEANAPMFTEPERRWGEYLHVDAARLREALEPDEETLRAAYEANIGSYTVDESRVIDQISIPDRDAAEAAVARLVSGEATFESLGAEFGLDEEALSLGRVTRDDLPGAAAELVFDEAEPGIIGPVALPAGFAVFRIREITEGGTAAFEDVRDSIAQRLAADALITRAPELANLIEERRAEGLSMQETAARAGEDGGPVAGLVYGRFEGLASDGSQIDGGADDPVVTSSQFLTEAFAALDAEERNLIETPDGGYLLVMVERIEPSALQPLDDVRERAVAAWQDAERLKSLEARAAELAARLGDDASIWDIGEELQVAAIPIPPFTRATAPAELPAALVEAVFRAGAAGGAFAPRTDGSAVILAQVNSIVPLPPEAMAQNSAQIDQAIANSLRSDMAEYFARAVEGRYETYVDAAVVDDIFRQLGAVSSPGQ